jgi:hypothetical protein
MRLLTLPHRGLGALAESYNEALRASPGSLVAILEGDDRWPSDKLALQVPSFDEPETVLSWGNAELIGEDGRPAGELVALRERGPLERIPTREAFHRLTRTNFLIPSVTVMIRRSVLDTLGGFKQTGSTMFVDLPTWLWATATHEGNVVFINRRLGSYRIHEGQTSRLRHAEMLQEHLQVVQRVEEALDAASLARVGWNDAGRRRAMTRALLARGETLLELGRRRESLAMFRDAWRLATGFGDTLLAVAGMTSSLLRLNLVRASFAARKSVLRRLRAPDGADGT